MDETSFNNYTSLDACKKESDAYISIECGKNEHISNLNSELGKSTNRNLNKSTAYKLVFVLVVVIIFTGCGNFVYFSAAGTCEVKYVIPDGYVLLPKTDNNHTSTSDTRIDVTSAPLSEVRESFKTSQSTTTTETTTKPECEAGWFAFGTSCYYFSEDAKTWQNAFDTCVELGSYLAEITSSAEDDKLAMTARVLGDSRWIGMSDKDKEGTWMWATSKTVSTYFNWGPGEPNNVTDEDCGSFAAYKNFLWNDSECYNLLKYICEK